MRGVQKRKKSFPLKTAWNSPHWVVTGSTNSCQRFKEYTGGELIVAEWTVSGAGHKRRLFLWTPNTLMMAGQRLIMVGSGCCFPLYSLQLGPSWARDGPGVGRGSQGNLGWNHVRYCQYYWVMNNEFNNISVLIQNKRGIEKSILDAKEISRLLSFFSSLIHVQGRIRNYPWP